MNVKIGDRTVKFCFGNNDRPVSFLGIRQSEPDIYIGFSPALHLQCKHLWSACIIFSRIYFVVFRVFCYELCVKVPGACMGGKQVLRIGRLLTRGGQNDDFRPLTYTLGGRGMGCRDKYVTS
jgi:hypothetical protein